MDSESGDETIGELNRTRRIGKGGPPTSDLLATEVKEKLQVRVKECTVVNR